MRDKQHQKNPTNADLTRKETTELKRYKKYITPYLSAFVIGPLMMLTEVAVMMVPMNTASKKASGLPLITTSHRPFCRAPARVWHSTSTKARGSLPCR